MTEEKITTVKNNYLEQDKIMFAIQMKKYSIFNKNLYINSIRKKDYILNFFLSFKCTFRIKVVKVYVN